MAVVEVSIIPLGTPTPSVGRYVAAALRVSTLIRIDARRDRSSGLEEKVRSVEAVPGGGEGGGSPA